MLQLDLVCRVFRVSADFRLVEAGRVDKERWPSSLVNGAYGWFVPKPGRTNQGTCVPASPESALLWHSLKIPGELPHHLRDGCDEKVADDVIGLLIARVLHVEHEGAFLTGLAAVRALGRRGLGGAANVGTARLSERAIVYAHRLFSASSSISRPDPLPAHVLAQRLYFYNTAPASPTLRRCLDIPDGVSRFLRLERFQGESLRLLERSWSFQACSPKGWWHYWQPSQTPITPKSLDSLRERSWAGDAKLYVSPSAPDLPNALDACLPIVFDSPATGAKVGSNVHGLFRPDKFVVYFSSLEDLRETAGRIDRVLSGMEAQGVPFTSSIDPQGLLSWGTDLEPSPDERHSAASWRVWVSQILADALCEVRGDSQEEALDRVVARAEIAGIDTGTWSPKTRLMKVVS